MPTVHASLPLRGLSSSFCLSPLLTAPSLPLASFDATALPGPTSSPPAKNVEEVGHAGCPIRLERTTLACPSGRSMFSRREASSFGIVSNRTERIDPPPLNRA